MGRFLEEPTLSKGFIKELLEKFQKTLTAEQVKNFANLESDEARYQFIAQNSGFKDFQVTRNKSIKNIALALDFKQKGNKAFQAQKWIQALDFYNKGLLVLPAEHDEDFSILLANRSAVMYRIEKFDHALQDIELAEEHYPADIMHKLKERAARCHLAQKSYEKALNSFKETITHLDISKLPMEKRGKLERDAQIMIKMLPQQVEFEKKNKKNESKLDKILKQDTQLNKAVAFDSNDFEGRFAKTNREMKVGDEIMVERALCASLFEKFSKSHCQFCFKRSITPVPCPNCVDVVFCSKSCRNAAIYTYHKYECGLLETIWNSGSSINCQMAMRIISQRPVSYFKSIRNQLSDNLTVEDIEKLPSHDYRRVYGMVRHEKKRTTYGYLQYAFMSIFLVKFLEANNYFGPADDSQEDDKIFIGGLILRNLQVLQFNSHEVFDLLKSTKTDAKQTVAIGAGLYTTLAFFNHSCNPSIVRYFDNTAVHVVAIRNLKTGERISENYGPLYSQNTKEVRQKKLKDFYWFDCGCEACEQNWPTFEDMNGNEIRFKCAGNKQCDNVITIPTDLNEFMIQCMKCGEFTNILKGLKAVQDTEMLEKTAKRLYKEGKIDDALKKYYEIMSIFDGVMAPPFPDYCKCQQAIKECLLEYGNRIQVD